MQIKVNDGEAKTVVCPSTGSYTVDSAETIYLDVVLQAGENIITLFNADGWAPNILSVGISKTTVEPDESESPSETSPEDTSENPSETLTENKEQNSTEQTTQNVSEKKDETLSGSEKTGDTSNTGIYNILFIISAAVMAAVVLSRKKNSKNEI